MAWNVTEIILDYPPKIVFDLMCDFERLGHAIPTVEKIEYISKVRRGVGTRTRWTVGVGIETDSGLVKQWEEEVTAFVENELLGFKMISEGFPCVGFLQVYPYEMGTKTFLVFGECHEYPGANMTKVNGLMRGQLEFMQRELSGTLKGDAHKRRE